MLTDTELLDGLERLFARVAVLRTCRSGVKLEVADQEFAYGDDGLICDRFFGSDVRTVIRNALSDTKGRTL